MIKTIYFIFFICAFSLGLWACTGKDSDKFKNLSSDQFEEMIQDKTIQLIDVRTVAEYSEGHIPGSININVLDNEFGTNIEELLQKDRPVAVYCKSGRRSRNAANILVKKGFKVYNLSKGMLSMLTVIIGLASKAEITILDEPAAGLDVIVREEFYKLIIDEQQENGRTFIISTHIIEEAANVFEEVIILKDKCVYLKENTVELLDKCRYVSGLEENVKNAVDGCKIINEEHIGRSYAVTVMQDGDGKIKAVQHVTVQPVSLQNLFIAICGQSNM